MRLLPPKNPKRVLVIGGGGYVGSGLVQQLKVRGHYVRVFDLSLFRLEPSTAEADETVVADFRNVARLTQAMTNIDTVVHLGGLVGDPACAFDVELTREINQIGARLVADAAKSHGIKRFVFASTCSVYGWSDVEVDEDSILNPVSLYAQSKVATERDLRRLQDTRFQPTILRFGTLYGLSRRLRFDLVVNLLTAKAVTEGEITVMGGNQWRPFVHVLDSAQAVLRVVEAPLSVVGGQTYNVGFDDQNYTIMGVAQEVRALVPDSKIVDKDRDATPEEREAFDGRNYNVSFAKIKRELGFEAKWDVRLGIQQIIGLFDLAPETDWKHPQYSNAAFLKCEAAKLIRRLYFHTRAEG